MSEDLLEDNLELWSEKIHKEVNPILEEIKNHPFIKKMMDGTLPLEKFGKYIGQDIFYCKEYSTSLNILSEKIKDKSQEGEQFFKKGANGCIELIDFLKKEYVEKLKLKEEKEISPVCQKYIDFERNNSMKSLPEGLAACLACY